MSDPADRNRAGRLAGPSGPSGPAGPFPVARLDLSGVACPVNWARTKARLETMERGQLLEIVVDDPRAVNDIPRAAEAEGHCVVALSQEEGRATIVIEV